MSDRKQISNFLLPKAWSLKLFFYILLTNGPVNFQIVAFLTLYFNALNYTTESGCSINPKHLIFDIKHGSNKFYSLR